MHVYTFVCVIYIYIYIYICVCVCVYVCMFVCVCTYVDIVSVFFVPQSPICSPCCLDRRVQPNQFSVFSFVCLFSFLGLGGPGGGLGGFLLGSRSSGLPLLLLPT